MDALEKLLPVLNEGNPARQVSLNEDEEDAVRPLGLLTRKPVIYATNVSEDDLATENSWVEQVRELAAKENAQVVVVSAQVESELIELPEEERADFWSPWEFRRAGLNL